MSLALLGLWAYARGVPVGDAEVGLMSAHFPSAVAFQLVTARII